jgi:uncharacterized protein (TIGR00661 family)
MTKKILVAPLNWGLGHATRCIPIINSLIEHNFEPLIASDGEALLLLQKTFPNLKSFELPGYPIDYPKNGRFLIGHLLLNYKKFKATYKAEQLAIDRLVKQEHLNGIISDNRFGCFHKKVKTVYITHQVRVLAGILTYFTSKIHQNIIQKYDVCWVPDDEKSSYAGKLSKSTSVKVKYIGILSRFITQQSAVNYDYLLLLSGPEPQRSQLEKILLRAFKNTEKRVLLVQGKVDAVQKEFDKEGVKIVNFMLHVDLQKTIAQSAVVIARSGYSTVMDLAVMHKKAFFIPTPGQTEQVYLANYLSKNKIAPFAKQAQFKMEDLKKVEDFNGFKEPIPQKDRLVKAMKFFK